MIQFNRNKKIKLFWTIGISLFFLSLLTTSCVNEPAETQPTTPVFSGLETIELLQPLNGEQYNSTTKFTYNAPSGVAYFVFGLFDASIATSNNRITNPQNFKFGSRTGLTDFSPGVQDINNMYPYDSATENFSSTKSTPGTGTYSWAVWGYDQYGNLTHSSAQRSVDIP